MPIRDYKADSIQAYESLLSDSKISDKNKEAVKRFDTIYQTKVKPATRAKFYRHLKFFLYQTTDVEKSMHEPDTINSIFARIHAKTSPGYYATIINTTNRFVKWLNDDIKPRGFKDIKSPSKASQKRNLVKADMWDWEDGLEVIKSTMSTQFKAMIMTQLNLGARPSEFIDLNFGDIEPKGEMLIVHIRGGKTGSREAILYYGAPYLSRWLNEHPTKNPKHPLWVTENAKNSFRKNPDGDFKRASDDAILRYQYKTLLKRLQYLAVKAGIKKPTDFYTLRHSCARLLRLWGVPIEECAKQLGHSVKEFTETYGRLDTTDRERRHAEAYGIVTEDEETRPDKPVPCPKCSETNKPGSEYCARCGATISLKKAIADEADMVDKIARAVMKKMSDDDGKPKPQ